MTEPMPLHRFTLRQRQVLRRIGLGMSYDAIALDLGIAPSTVKIHAAMVKARSGLDHLPAKAACKQLAHVLALAD